MYDDDTSMLLVSHAKHINFFRSAAAWIRAYVSYQKHHNIVAPGAGIQGSLKFHTNLILVPTQKLLFPF